LDVLLQEIEDKADRMKVGGKYLTNLDTAAAAAVAANVRMWEVLVYRWNAWMLASFARMMVFSADPSHLVREYKVVKAAVRSLRSGMMNRIWQTACYPLLRWRTFL
jgi:hypothetical protein